MECEKTRFILKQRENVRAFTEDVISPPIHPGSAPERESRLHREVDFELSLIKVLQNVREWREVRREWREIRRVERNSQWREIRREWATFQRLDIGPEVELSDRQCVKEEERWRPLCCTRSRRPHVLLYRSAPRGLQVCRQADGAP